jgi:hypothetical protein
MIYPKLKRIITLKKAEIELKRQERVQMEQYSQAYALRKLLRGGQRLDPSNMQVITLKGKHAGLLFQKESMNEELSMNMWDGTFRDLPTPNRDTIQELENELNNAHHSITPGMMFTIFPTWGESQLDKWAIECNSSYAFMFSIYYDVESMTTRQVIKLLGKPNIDLPTYVDKYSQAQIMHKLESNL